MQYTDVYKVGYSITEFSFLRHVTIFAFLCANFEQNSFMPSDLDHMLIKHTYTLLVCVIQRTKNGINGKKTRFCPKTRHFLYNII